MSTFTVVNDFSKLVTLTIDPKNCFWFKFQTPKYYITYISQNLNIYFDNNFFGK